MSKSKGPRGPTLTVPKTLFTGTAASALRSVNSVRVLWTLLQRRQMVRVKRGKRQDEWHIANNGEIVLTYAEAKRRLRLSPQAYRRAIDELVELGFVDIERPGNGAAGIATGYAISERWRDYGTEAFVQQRRQKDTRRLGYRGRRGRASGTL